MIYLIAVSVILIIWIVGAITAITMRWQFKHALFWPVILLMLKLFGGRPQ